MREQIRDVLRQNLRGEQFLAATDESAEILTLACAGSGKSRTLAYRIARLIGDGEPQNSIVAFTFTEKAADSLKLRMASALSQVGIPATVIGAAYVGTIHSYCQYILGQIDAKYRQFDVLDGNKFRLYLISRYGQLGLKALRTQHGARYFQTVDQVTTAWTTVNDELLQIENIVSVDPLLGETLEKIRAGLDRDQFIDFSLMIRLVVDALRRADPNAERAVAGLRHLSVDEYQDVNPSQEALIRELQKRARTLCVVGDDDQAIYAWRGADVQNILTFEKRYPNASRHTLSTNFRSTSAIVESADAFISAELGATRLTKNPKADDVGGSRDFRNVWFGTRDDEAQWVADRIVRLLGTECVERDGTRRGLTPADFAILMRSTKLDSGDGHPRHAPFTRALVQRDIEYSLEAGGAIFDRVAVEILRAAFDLLHDRTPTRDEAEVFFKSEVLPTYHRAKFERFANVLSRWGRLIHTPPGGARRRVYPQQLVHDLLNAFNVAECGFDSSTLQDIGVFSRILQDVESVYLSIDSASRFQEILHFLNNSADAGYDSATDDVLQRPDAVTVSTVHRAKGLEFPAVFIVDVEAQRFPKNSRRYTGWLHPSVIAPALARGAYQATRSEEARLFYTALTRGERYLCVSGSQQVPGGKRVRKQSDFAMRLQHVEISTDSTSEPSGLTASTPLRRVDESILSTSYSDVRYYLRCPRDYQFRKSFGFSPAITEMFGFGMTVHAAVGKLHEVFRDSVPTPSEAFEIATNQFHLKHVPPSKDPANSPGPYENAKKRSGEIVRQYARDYASDFGRKRQVEARFEVPVKNAVVSGSIDLLLNEDANGDIIDANVIDFKTMEESDALDWTELSLQVQLYAKAARDVLGENAKTGSVHLLKDGQRIDVPVDDTAIVDAIANVEWAVDGIIRGEYPMRPGKKCELCDFRLLCSQVTQEMSRPTPPAIHLPTGQSQHSRAFSDFDPNHIPCT